MTNTRLSCTTQNGDLLLRNIFRSNERNVNKCLRNLKKQTQVVPIVRALFSLQNISINMEIVKALGDFIKHQFQISSVNLDFDYSSYPSNMISNLLNAIQALENLEHLSLSCQQIRQSICEERIEPNEREYRPRQNLQKLTTVFLDMSGQNLNDLTLQSLLDLLSSAPFLAKISLSLENVKLKKEKISLLSQGLSKSQNLSDMELFLGRNSIDEISLKTLACGICAPKHLRKLILSIESNNIGDNGIENILSAVNKLNLVFLVLNLEDNQVTDAGAEKIERFIRQVDNKLSVLDLQLRNNRISFSAALSLCRGIRRSKSLNNFRVSWMQLRTKEQKHKLYLELIKSSHLALLQSFN